MDLLSARMKLKHTLRFCSFWINISKGKGSDYSNDSAKLNENQQFAGIHRRGKEDRIKWRYPA